MNDHTPAQRPPKRGKVAALVLAAVASIGLAVGGWSVAPLLIDGGEYAAVPSIEHRTDYRDAAAMEAAWRLPVAAAYRSHPYEFQTNPSFCGPASLANLLRSTGRNVSQGEVLRGSKHRAWFGLLIPGLTLDEVAELLRLRSGRPVVVVRGASLPEFRAHLARTNDPARRYLANFHRGPLFGRGHGHHSPLLGYLADRDLVLVGDVNADYRPFLVSSERLWRAAETIDSETGKKRGLLFVEVRPDGNGDSLSPE